MKKVLCFGDSNTYGFIPESKRRYDINTRWTGVLQSLLNDKYEIVECGCNNRTAFQDNPFGEEVTGYKALTKYLDESYDIVILAVGLNDIQTAYRSTLEDIKNGMESLVETAKTLAPMAKIILVAPAKIGEEVLTNEFFSRLFNKDSVEKSLAYSSIYNDIAKTKGCTFADWDKIVKTSEVDGLHLSVESHKKIAFVMKDVIEKL